MLTRELIARLPKAELHVHLDGSLRPRDDDRAGPRRAGELPGLRSRGAAPRSCWSTTPRDLEDYLTRFDITVALLQTPEAIERVAYEMVEDAARDNLRYLEVRYCPHLSTRGGLSMDEASWRSSAGFARGERDFGVLTGIINCTLRHYDPARSVEIAEHSVRFATAGVVAFDLAGGEAGRPPGRHGEAFDIALAGDLGITVHAGEAAGAESVAEAIRRCHAERIGHGTRLGEDPGAAGLHAGPADPDRDQHHQQPADPRRGARPRSIRCGATSMPGSRSRSAPTAG